MSLQSRKRQLVQDAIYDAAIDLFAEKGFDETTVEEVAEAAGISRRSFFRYFESKDDLLALNTVHVGEILCKTVVSCPAGMDLLDVVRETIMAGVRSTEAQEHTRQIIEIATRSASARQAHQSRLVEVEDRLASAFGARMKSTARDYMKPRLLAGVTMLVNNTAVASWFKGEHKDMTAAAKHSLLTLTRMFSEQSSAASGAEPVSTKTAPAPKALKKPRNTKK